MRLPKLLDYRDPSVQRIAISVTIIVTIGFIWFGTGIMVNTDSSMPFNGPNYTERMFNVWDYVSGFQDIRHILLWTWSIFSYVFFEIGMLLTGNDLEGSVAFLELVIYFITAITAVLGMAKLLNFLIKVKGYSLGDQRTQQMLVGAISFMYLFSIWSINFVWRAYWPYLFHLGFIPLFTYFFLRFTSSKKFDYRYFVACMLVLPLLLPAYSVFVSIVFDFILIFVLALMTFGNFKRLLIRTSMIAAMLCVLLLPFAFPAFLGDQSTNVVVSRIITTTDINNLLNYNSPNILHAMANTGYPPFYSAGQGAQWYLNMPFFNESLYMIAIIGLVMLPFVVSRKLRRDRTATFLLLAFVACITLMSSIKAPFPIGEALTDAYSLDILKLLRSTFVRFSEYATFSSLILIALGWSAIIRDENLDNGRRKGAFEWFRKNKVKTFALVLVSIVLLPTISSALELQAWNAFGTEQPIHTNIPEGYATTFAELGAISNINNNNIVIYPYPNDLKKMDWYSGQPILSFGAYGRTIDVTADYETSLLVLTNAIENKQTSMYAPYILLYADDAITAGQNQANLDRYYSNALPIIIKYPGYSSATLDGNGNFSMLELGENNGSRFYSFPTAPTSSIINQRIVGMQNGKELMAFEPLNSNLTIPFNNIWTRNITSECDGTINLENTNINNQSTIRLIDFANVDGRGSIHAETYLFLNLTLTHGTLIADIGMWSDGVWTTLGAGFMNASGAQTKTSYNFTLSNDSATVTLKNGLESMSLFIGQHELVSFNKAREEHSQYDIKVAEEYAMISSNPTTGLIPSNWTIEYDRPVQTLEDLFVGGIMDESHTKSTINDYTRTDPSNWDVGYYNNNRSLLMFAETYDPSWTANVYVNGTLTEKLHSIPVFGLANGFWISSTGNVSVHIEYDTQTLVNYGYISAISIYLIVMAVSITLAWRERPRNRS